jgi:DNA-binding NarL/FixJ family response regulator
VRVVIGEDSLLLREGLARLLAETGHEVVAQAGDAEDLLRKVGGHRPDLAIIDVRLPPSFTDEGIRAALTIRDRWAGVAVLVLSEHVETTYAVELFAGGTDGLGYLLKQRVSDLDQFADAVKRVASGGSALDPEVVRHLLGRHRDGDPLQRLTPRETEVLGLMAEGRSNHAIAEQLVITESAVEKHVSSIFGKLDLPPTADAHRRVLAVLKYLQAPAAAH